ncbi:hypothetical protein M3223_20260 [Paenibacillus pasadenensis]|uniref:hypothetical protein n=1 Tax=Paenibacillus pasadenensis TaxID=217090 RepID=UPI002040EF64|nr:hypothetical protein [Paenibacillus pasadenensis]MCM3749690.1 hypothetical protein [Paenibacillus pasadenensis]
MSRLDLIVAAAESEYVRRLSEFARNSSFGKRWRITSCTSGDSLRHYLKGGYPVHVLLAQPALLKEAGELPEHLVIAALVRRKGEGGGFSELLQYQPLPELLSGIEAVQAGGTREGLDLDGSSAVVSICSAVGGVGKTICSLWLARLAAERGMRVLYLNLEHYHSAECHLRSAGEASEEGGFEALLYAVKSGKQNIGTQIAQLRKYSRRMKVDYIGEPSNSEERAAMTGKDAHQLLQALAESRLYDLIIADLDSIMDDASAAVWSRSDAICWLSEAAPSSSHKSRLALQDMSRRYPETMEKAHNKLIYLCSQCRQPIEVEHGENGAALSEEGTSLFESDRLPFTAHIPYAPGLEIAPDAPPSYIRAVGQLLCRLFGPEPAHGGRA